ncbi:MAG: DEAD/DEAH box helicase [Alphaproteobacteria bacterium]|nr:DEAD/DEAH box helicase [Alphaproteobacteria bacterium]
MTVSTFAALGLSEALNRALAADSYVTPTPIQAQAIPVVLAGRDLIGIAQTGTGKTAAFALPILHRLAQDRRAPVPQSPRALILAPTRELALQIGESCRAYGRHLGLRQAVIFGGVGQNPQVDALRRGIDLLIATPGRLLDLMNQRHVRLHHVSVLVLDEADRMLDMGFIRDVRKIVATIPRERQSLLFSATMPDEVVKLANEILRSPTRIDIAPTTRVADRIEQRVYAVAAPEKSNLLMTLLRDPQLSRVVVFTRTKHGAKRLAIRLEKNGVIADSIHGDKAQGARQRALEGFRSGQIRVLVATDVAARGIDVDDVSHVVNFEIPNTPESYTHRIGRTARAGAAGVAISFCDPSERGDWREIERVTKQRLAPIPFGQNTRPAPHGQRPNEHRRKAA